MSLRTWHLLGFALLAGWVAFGQSPGPVPTQPTLAATIRTGGGPWKPLIFEKVDIEVKLLAAHAITSLTLTLENPNYGRMEGELALPLAPDQTVAGFGLDIDGTLREASVVERSRAELAYSSIVRRNVDPGLLELTGLNLYRLRIFPLPDHGRRTVRLVLRQPLKPLPDGFSFVLPLNVSNEIKQVSLRVVDGGGRRLKPEVKASPLPLVFEEQRGAWVAQSGGLGATSAPTLTGRLELALPQGLHEPSQTLGRFAGQTYAYAQVRLPAQDEVKVKPRKVLLAWDCSRSGEARDQARLWAALKDYLSTLDGDLEVWPFNVNVIQKKHFPKVRTQLDALCTFLDQLPSDGTCRLDALDFSTAKADEVLLCTPGLTRVFDGIPKRSPVPVQVLMASTQAEWLKMRDYARSTGGEALDLMAMTRPEVRRALQRSSFQFLGCEVIEGKVADLVPEKPRPVKGGMGLACILGSERARLRLKFGRNGKMEWTQDVQFEKALQEDAIPAQLWALARLEDLEAARPTNRLPLLNLALQHHLVTKDTALLVLETQEDYRRYGIPIPPELREAWRLPPLNEKVENPTPEPVPDLQEPQAEPFVESEALQAWIRARKAWWSMSLKGGLPVAKDFGFWKQELGSMPEVIEDASQSEPPPPPPMPFFERFGFSTLVPDGTLCSGLRLMPTLGFPGGQADGDEDMPFSPGERRQDRYRTIGMIPKEDMSMAVAGCATGGPGTGMAVAGGSDSRHPDALAIEASEPKAEAYVEDPSLPREWPQGKVIQLEEPESRRHWRPMGTRAQALVRSENRVECYAEYRQTFCNSPSFYVDCARIFAKAGDRPMALGILSNLGEDAAESNSGSGSDSTAFVRLCLWGEVLWELGETATAKIVFAKAQERVVVPENSYGEMRRQGRGSRVAMDRNLLLRQAKLAKEQGELETAKAFLQACAETTDPESLDPLQGLAWEALQAMRAEHPNAFGKAELTVEPMPVWGLRIEVEGMLPFLRLGHVSLVDPRGERVWQEMPLGTQGLGLDDSAHKGPHVFMNRKLVPGTYRVELNSGGLHLDEHIPQEFRVRVITGFGSAHPKVREYRKVMRSPSEKLVAVFQVP